MFKRIVLFVQLDVVVFFFFFFLGGGAALKCSKALVDNITKLCCNLASCGLHSNYYPHMSKKVDKYVFARILYSNLIDGCHTAALTNSKRGGEIGSAVEIV